MKKINIRDIAELHQKRNEIFTLVYSKIKNIIQIKNIRSNIIVTETRDIELIMQYGFDIATKNKATREEMESIADENGVGLHYKRGQWYYSEYEEFKTLSSLLNEYKLY